VATPEQVAHYQALARTLLQDREDLRRQRAMLNRLHSYAGDHNLPCEGATGLKLESTD